MAVYEDGYDPMMPDEKAVSDKRSFASRDQIERAILLDKGRRVGLEGTWKICKDTHGKDIVDEKGNLVWTWGNEIWVPRWSLRMMLQCSDRIASIIATLFPDDMSFLFKIDMNELATAAAKINEILFFKVAPEVFDICCYTLGIETDEDRSLFERRVTPRDLLEIFVTIIEHEINNESMQAITKKVQRLLGEKFSLENVFPNLSEVMAGLPMPSLMDIPQANSISYPNTQQSPIE